VEEKTPIFTRSFFFLNIIYFLIFSNLAIFFNYYSYLKTLPIAPEWFGFLIGLDALIAMIVRPFISTFFTARNAPFTILWSTALVLLALLGYTAARELLPMLLVRVLHGISFVVVSSALIAYTVLFIPPSRSAQAFGIISVSFLLPYTVIPYAVEWILASFKSYEATFLFAALLILPVFPILLLINKKPIHGETPGAQQRGRLTFNDVATNLKDRRIAALLLISVVTFTAFSILYYFLKSFAIHIGAKDIGYFFTIYAVTMICVRLTVGRFFDRANKYSLLLMSIVFTGFSYFFAGRADSMGMLYIFAFFFGVGIGVVVPLINGIAFDISDPQMRGFNLNLIIETRDLGFFIGPIIATPILNQHGYTVLYYFCGAISIVSVILMPVLTKQKGGP
jgi:predicted MFS family arabinose efflux permease